MPPRGTETSGDRLAALLANCRKASLIALEDIDCLTNESQTRGNRILNTNDNLTVADLLNVVDSIGASEDRVLFMTANHPETLDFSLTRAGRIGRKFSVDYATDEELRNFHKTESLTIIQCSLGRSSGPRCRSRLPLPMHKPSLLQRSKRSRKYGRHPLRRQ